MDEDKFDYGNLDEISGDDWQDELLNSQGEDEGYEWKPRFPIDLENPRELTDEQRERAKKVFDCISAHIDANPEDTMAPMICITQDWRVRVDFGGWNSDSDYRDTALCVMARDKEGFYLDLKYVEQCVPYIEEKLKEIAEWCQEEYGEVPDHHENDKRRVAEMEMAILSILSDDRLEAVGIDNVYIAYDEPEGSIYPWPAAEEREEYGGLIKYVPARNFVDSDGAILVDKIKAFVSDTLRPL